MEESMIGKKVRYRDETWEVVHVTEDRRAIIVQIGVDVKMGAIRVDPIAVMVDLDEIEEIPHELTAKEYAEKLRRYFRKPEIGELDIEACFCSERNCQGCAFDADPNCAAAVCMFDPDRALQMIQEAENKNKPKGKTYLQDFLEKLPRTAIGQGGIPFICLKNVYGEEASADDVCKEGNCKKCWDQKMPEDDNGKG